MASYYPSAKVKLAIRLEEFSDPLFKPADLPPRNGVSNQPAKAVAQKAALVVVQDPDRPGALLLQQMGTTKKTLGPGQAQQESMDGYSQTVDGILPKKASWGLNGIKTADTLSVTIRWQDCPIDPRVVRSCAIDFYLGAVPATQFAEGIGGMRREAGGNESGMPMNLIPDTYVDAEHNALVRSNLRFQGWVDDWHVTMDDSGEAVIELQCRDNTQLLLDQKASQTATPRIVTDKPIDEAIAEYMAFFPQFEGLTVEYRPTDTKKADKPTLKGVVINLPLVALGPPPSKGGGGDDGMSVWDYMTDCCGALGLNIRFEGTSVLIESPTTLVNENALKRPEDPYFERRVGDTVYDVRTFIYGQNVSSMEFSRKYDAKKPGNIEVRAYFPGKKKQLVARYPTKENRLVSANPGDGQADQKWKVIRISYPVEDQKVLERVAIAQYYARNRTELEANIKTKDLTSYGGRPGDTDLLDARPGDSVQLLIDHAAYGTVATVDGFLDSFASNAKYMTQLGFSAKFVAAYQKSRINAGFPKKFVLKEMQVEWDVDSGVEVTVKCVNFIVARMDKDPPGTTVKR